MIKKGLKLLSGDKNLAFNFMLPLVLLPTDVDAIMKEGCYKINTIRAFGSGGGKVIPTLLAEVIAFHVGLTTIDVR